MAAGQPNFEIEKVFSALEKIGFPKAHIGDALIKRAEGFREFKGIADQNRDEILAAMVAEAVVPDDMRGNASSEAKRTAMRLMVELIIASRNQELARALVKAANAFRSAILAAVVTVFVGFGATLMAQYLEGNLNQFLPSCIPRTKVPIDARTEVPSPVQRLQRNDARLAPPNKQMQLTIGSAVRSTAVSPGTVSGRFALRLAALPLATDL